MLEAEGASIQSVTLPSLVEFAAVNRVILASEAYSIHARWLRERPGDYGKLSRRRLLPGAFIPASPMSAHSVGARR